MSKRKGLSAEEKRTRMLQLFREKKDFFQMKELERIAPKEKGIVSQSVKEVVQSLVDEGLVDSDKIGTSLYYWAFPSKAVNTRKHKLADLTQVKEQKSKRLKRVLEEVKQNKALRQETEERKKVLESLTKLREEESRLLKEIENYEDSDPYSLEKTKTETQVAKDSANRWTDNIFMVKSWCKSKFFMEASVLDKHFEIDPEMDYLD